MYYWVRLNYTNERTNIINLTGGFLSLMNHQWWSAIFQFILGHIPKLNFWNEAFDALFLTETSSSSLFWVQYREIAWQIIPQTWFLIYNCICILPTKHRYGASRRWLAEWNEQILSISWNSYDKSIEAD